MNTFAIALMGLRLTTASGDLLMRRLADQSLEPRRLDNPGARTIAHYVGTCDQCGLDWCNGFYEASQEEFDQHYVEADDLATWGCQNVHSGTKKIRVARGRVYAVEEREDAFCPPMLDVSAPACRNVLRPPVQDKTEEECLELCKNNPKCLWAAWGPSHCQNCNYGPYPLKNIPSGGPAPFVHIKKGGQCSNVQPLGHDLFTLSPDIEAYCGVKGVLRLGGCKNAQWEAPLDLGAGKITVQVRSDESRRDPTDTMQIFHVASDGTERELWEGVNNGCFPVHCDFTFSWPGKGTIRVVAASSNTQYLSHMAITKLEYTQALTGFTFHQEGHCASGWLGANTVVSSLEGCYERCKDESAFGYETAPCAYFSYEEETGTCATYTGEAGCPDDDLFPTYKSYKMIRVPAPGSPVFARDETFSVFPVEIGQSSELGMIKSFSAAAWVYLTAEHGDQQGDFAIFGGSAKLHLMVRNGQYYLGFHYNDCSGGANVLNEYQHVVFVYDFPTRRQMIYVNGVLVTTCENKPPFQGDELISLGSWQHGSWQNRRLWQGEIREPRIYDYALTPDAVNDMYNGGETCYLKYCNEHPDLMNAFCGGAQCTDRAHYNSCKSHWETYRDINLQTRTFNPESCKPITLEEVFCPPMHDVSGRWCRNVLSPPVQDKTEEECKELCRQNPKCLWAASGPSHCQNCNYGPFPLKNIPSGSPAPLMHVRRSRAPNGQCQVVTRAPTPMPTTITLEEVFCPPMRDVSGRYCRNVLSPPVQDKTEEECLELCASNPRCLWAATGPSHCQNCNYGPFPLKNIPSGSPAPFMHVRRSRAPNGQCVTSKPTPMPTPMPTFPTIKCDMRPSPLAPMDLNKDFRIHLEVTADQDWVQAGNGGGGIFGFRDNAKGGNFGLYARFNGGLHYAIHAADITGRWITTGSYGNGVFYKYAMNLGQTYDMVIEWTGALFTWTIDGETVLSREAPNGFGSHHRQKMMCYGLGGGAKGFKGTVKVLQME